MVKWKFWKKHIQIPLLKVLRSFTVRRILWGGFFFFVTTLIMGINFLPERIELKVGQPSPKDFPAPRSISYASEVLTEIARQEEADKVEPLYEIDESVLKGLVAQIKDYFDIVYKVRQNTELDNLQKVEELKQEFNGQLSDEVLLSLVEADSEVLNKLAQSVVELVTQYLEEGIRQDEVEKTRDKMLIALAVANMDDHYRPFLTHLIRSLDLKANSYYDPIATAQAKEKARKQVEPVIVTIPQEKMIVRKNDIVTAEHIEALEKLGLLRSREPFTTLFGLSLLVMLGYILILLYLYQYKPDIYRHEHSFILLGLLIVITMLIARAVTAIDLGERPEASILVGYLVPLAASSMLVAILLDTKLSVFVTTILSIYVAIISGNQLQFAIVAVAGGIAGIYSVSKLSQRSDLAKASIYIILTNLITIVSIGLMLNYSPSMIAVGMALGLANGILSSVLTIGTLPFWETAFGITTSVKLLELSNPNQPILKRLLMEAPGTYHHSIIVGNLAETAADAVGADSLLARVGAYYHDIGKVKRPYFFIENQLGSENPHDKLTPTLSTLIITSHVKDGIELARQHKLPKVIVDIIEQHHGTGLISYFYHRALENEKGTVTVLESDFRYDSRKPQTKEAAIVLLADCVEAGVRSMQKISPGKIEGFVRKIIRERLEDGQLEECDLTFKELDIIAQAFVRVLNGIFHSRIEYPETVLKEMERGKVNAVNRKQSAG